MVMSQCHYQYLSSHFFVCLLGEPTPWHSGSCTPEWTDYSKYFLYLLAVFQWNRIPALIATLTDLNSYKHAVSQVVHLKR